MTEYKTHGDEAAYKEVQTEASFEPTDSSGVEQTDAERRTEDPTGDLRGQFTGKSVCGHIGRYADKDEPAVSGSGD